jgi:hypothetical protein
VLGNGSVIIPVGIQKAPTGDKLGNVIRAEISATAVFYWPAGLSDAVPVLVHFFRGAVGRRFACLSMVRLDFLLNNYPSVFALVN